MLNWEDGMVIRDTKNGFRMTGEGKMMWEGNMLHLFEIFHDD